MYGAHYNVIYKFAIKEGAFDRGSLFTRNALRVDRV